MTRLAAGWLRNLADRIDPPRRPGPARFTLTADAAALVERVERRRLTIDEAWAHVHHLSDGVRNARNA
ncbi:hypothetical protein NONO_c17730 [Nocardia nova SH22a]|uniref:Uncharacterized protein n=1 Tax=Nocardia nova SH22a TaxID=1415166 RepID=W5TC72_9NOCA|nr:hypothetical protein [Nocardia nova]AHH16573.1 hypothetical protein NONO_c17730 [Nocardia nova SH22a]